MRFLKQYSGRVTRATVVAVLCAGLGGCGGGGIALEGKVFDWMGVSESAQAAAKREPQLADRSPLVLPPDTNRLPPPDAAGQPGTSQIATGALPANAAPGAAPQAWPQDPDKVKAQKQAELVRQHQEYCRGGNWKQRAMSNGEAPTRGPLGSCSEMFGQGFDKMMEGITNKPQSSEPAKP